MTMRAALVILVACISACGDEASGGGARGAGTIGDFGADTSPHDPARPIVGGDAKLEARVGAIQQRMDRDGTTERTVETSIGDLVADAMLYRYQASSGFPWPPIALVNAGAIRAPLPSPYLPLDLALRRGEAPYKLGPPFDLVAGDIAAALPFPDACVIVEITGAALREALEHSVASEPAPFAGFLSVAGLRFSFKQSAAPGARLQAVKLLLANEIDIPPGDTRTYRVVTNDYLAAGGDGYTTLQSGAPVERGPLVATVVGDYIRERTTVPTPIRGRIVALP